MQCEQAETSGGTARLRCFPGLKIETWGTRACGPGYRMQDRCIRTLSIVCAMKQSGVAGRVGLRLKRLVRSCYGVARSALFQHLRIGKAVADVQVREQVHGMRRIVLDLLAQLAHEGSQ